MTPSENQRLARLKADVLPGVARDFGVGESDLWAKFLDTCRRDGVPSSVGRGSSRLVGLAKGVRA